MNRMNPKRFLSASSTEKRKPDAGSYRRYSREQLTEEDITAQFNMR
jgi:hypothetical protein